MRMSGRIGDSKICAVVAAENAVEMWRQLQGALKEAKTIELRLDWLANDGEIEKFLARFAQKFAESLRGTRAGRKALKRATFIATCRRRMGGGRYRGTIAKQLFYLAEALRAGCEWYDLEIESASRCPPDLIDVLLGSGQQLCSAHFFRRARVKFSSVAMRLRR